MTVTIEKEISFPADLDPDETVYSVVSGVLSAEAFPYEASVAVLFTGDNEIREMNRDNRGIDIATDVLSFPMIGFDRPGDYSILDERPMEYADPETDEIFLGDIVISMDHAVKQAEAYGHSLRREVAFLTAHSMLHLLGYDHETDPEREVMEKKQEEILEALGLTRECR